MPIGEVCDESFNDRANQGGRQRFGSENRVRNGFQGSGKNRAIAKGRICYLPSMDNRIKPRDAV